VYHNEKKTKKDIMMWGSRFTELGNGLCSFGPSFGHGPWFFGWLFPIIFWGIIAYFIFSILRHFFSGSSSNQNDSALEILRNRFAAGEINEQEYNAKKMTLSK
jgi:putative membrane protein